MQATGDMKLLTRSVPIGEDIRGRNVERYRERENKIYREIEQK